MRLCICVSAAAYAWEVNCKSWGWEETSSSSEFATYLMLVRMLTLQPFPADKWPLSQLLFSLFIYLFPFPKGHKRSKTNENKKKLNQPKNKQTNPKPWIIGVLRFLLLPVWQINCCSAWTSTPTMCFPVFAEKWLRLSHLYCLEVPGLFGHWHRATQYGPQKSWHHAAGYAAFCAVWNRIQPWHWDLSVQGEEHWDFLTTLETLLVAFDRRFEIASMADWDWFQWMWYCLCTYELGKVENENSWC